MSEYKQAIYTWRGLIFLENKRVASKRDLSLRTEMKMAGYRQDPLKSAVPTRDELKAEYISKGIHVIFGKPINGYNGRNEMNKHQFVGVVISEKEYKRIYGNSLL